MFHNRNRRDVSLGVEIDHKSGPMEWGHGVQYTNCSLEFRRKNISSVSKYL